MATNESAGESRRTEYSGGTGAVRWHGRQKGVVNLAERKLRVDKPRLRRKGRGKGSEVNPFSMPIATSTGTSY